MSSIVHPGKGNLQAQAREDALLAWFASGADPHQQPGGNVWLPDLPQSGAVAHVPFPPGEDRSPWALALRFGSPETVQAALDAGAEPSRRVGVAWSPRAGTPAGSGTVTNAPPAPSPEGQGHSAFGMDDWRSRSMQVASVEGSGWVAPGIAILAGPAETAQAKLQLGQDSAEDWLHGRWPDPASQWATAVHMVTDLQAEGQDVRPQAVEGVARSLLDDLLAGKPHRVMARDRAGAVPLHWSLGRARYAIAERLLAVLPIAQARAVDHAGNTVLHALVAGAAAAAAALPQVQSLPLPLQRIATTLVEHGALWERPNHAGVTAFDLAMHHFGKGLQAAQWRHFAGQ